MRAAVVVEADPVTDDAGRVLDALKAIAVNALLLEGADDALDHAVIRHDAGGASGVGSAIVRHPGVDSG